MLTGMATVPRPPLRSSLGYILFSASDFAQFVPFSYVGQVAALLGFALVFCVPCATTPVDIDQSCEDSFRARPRARMETQEWSPTFACRTVGIVTRSVPGATPYETFEHEHEDEHEHDLVAATPRCAPS
jgi:hypothetical protein